MEQYMLEIYYGHNINIICLYLFPTLINHPVRASSVTLAICLQMSSRGKRIKLAKVTNKSRGN